ncbi:acyltransferase [Massilia sp.]|uniref:acyltransferase family protein n=1 Tax=Massilia sp. TaxID=1882437 RepID=UPI0028ACE97B|nr:acyltransferase [Massilia sp.]
MSAAGAVPVSNGVGDKQYVLINVLKAVAAQLIVLHHLAFYGPMADHAWPLAPDLFSWLAGDARIAVQVFLVIGGFLAAKSLSPHGLPGLDHPLRAIGRRYLKLAPPFIVAMLFAVLASYIAGAWMDHDSISAPPSLLQFGAHMVLLQDVLGYEALSAGAWYVAIDFQLYGLMCLLLWLSGRLGQASKWRWVVPALVGVGVTASLFFFNRDSDWDIWAPYFFASYGLGALAWWASDPKRQPVAIMVLLLLIVAPTQLALAVDFRVRIAVAFAVACLLLLLGRERPALLTGHISRLMQLLARTSYSVFLVHFPVCLVVNAAFTRFAPELPHIQFIGMVVGWTSSLIAGAAFYRWVEVPIGHVFAQSPHADEEKITAAKVSGAGQL